MLLDNIVYLFILVAFFLLFLSLRIVKEYDRGMIFFLGKVTGVRGPALIILIPILEQMTQAILRTITMNISSQKIITKDNVSIDIAAVAYYKIIDPVKSVIAIEDITRLSENTNENLSARITPPPIFMAQP
jgi:regulator of protease activity HflC (stomatin/prohibitin superfamily)